LVGFASTCVLVYCDIFRCESYRGWLAAEHFDLRLDVCPSSGRENFCGIKAPEVVCADLKRDVENVC
jgi:hypothetical protein